MKMIKHIFIINVFFQISTINSAKILGFYCTPSPSHLIVHSSLIYELANRGHDVTMITTLQPTGKEPKNIRLISLNIEHKEFNKMIADWLKPIDDNEPQPSLLQKAYNQYEAMLKITGRYESMLSHPDYLRIKNETFDLVIFGWFMNDFQLGVAAHFNAPAVLTLPSKMTVFVRPYIGNPNVISHVPGSFSPYKDSMNFYQRLVNFFLVAGEHLIVYLSETLIQRPYYDRNFPSDQYPSYEEARKNVALVLVAHHFSQGSMEPNLPGAVEVGGMHIKPADVLPKDVKNWLDSASDGAIFFSLGSNAKSTQIPSHLLNGMLRSFSNIKQKVIMKWEDDKMPNKPANVLIGKWMPQSDILAHPNMKLFISHCGLGSVNEAKYHGIPILGMPIFADQPKNLEAIIEEGWSIGEPLEKLTEESFDKYLSEMLKNPKYGDIVKTASDLYKDRPQSAIETAVYWVEYVLRHKGAKHMQSPAIHLNFFQYHSLDVIGFIIVCIYLFVKVLKFAICAFVGICRSKVSKIKSD